MGEHSPKKLISFTAIINFQWNFNYWNGQLSWLSRLRCQVSQADLFSLVLAAACKVYNNIPEVTVSRKRFLNPLELPPVRNTKRR